MKAAYFLVPIVILIVACFAYKFMLRKKKGVDLKVIGSGDHFIFFVHGFCGSSDDFHNLRKDIDKKKYTMVFPGSVSGFKGLNYGLMESSKKIYEEIKKGVDMNNMKKISFLGNSLGGLYSKLLLKLMKEGGLLNGIKKETFITIATPHLGLTPTTLSKLNLLEETWNGIKVIYLRLFVRGKIGKDIIFPSPVRELTESSKIISGFKNRINYSNARFDVLVPFWSSSMELDPSKLDYHGIKEHKTKLYEVEWRTFTVPITMLHPFNHGNIIGKYLDGRITFNNDKIRVSIKHVNKWFI